MTPLLELDKVRAGYEDSIAIDGVSLTVGEGEVVCLLGANGAGKTTTMRAVTGLIPLAGGKIIYRGRDISTMPTHLRVAEGICLAPEGRQIFPELTVLENLRLGSFCARARAQRNDTMEQVFSLFPRLKERVNQDAGSMSGGEQQMLAIGRALMGQPKLLALDEPSLGLAPKIMMTVFDSIRAIAKAGITILLVEQNTRAALTVAQRGYVLATGRVVYEGSAEQLVQSEMVQQAFVGSRPLGPGERKGRRQRRLEQADEVRHA
jgi:branched-chain amino acid transport system ATP-binding protein